MGKISLYKTHLKNGGNNWVSWSLLETMDALYTVSGMLYMIINVSSVQYIADDQ